MKIASWNVNSVRARMGRLQAWLEKERPDVLCLQETKVTDKDFPHTEIETAGYRTAAYGQKTYNGVAILSRTDLTDVSRGFTGEGTDEEARLLAADAGGIRIVNVYVPNGRTVGSEAYAHKLEWLARLRRYLDECCRAKDPVLLCGDFNVAPEERDVNRPEEWRSSVLFHERARAALEQVRAFGLVDTLRLHQEAGGIYSWWDYRALSFPRNEGLRIDQIYVTPPLAERCTAAYVDREERKGQKPSDHAPVVAVLD